MLNEYGGKWQNVAKLMSCSASLHIAVIRIGMLNWTPRPFIMKLFIVASRPFIMQINCSGFMSMWKLIVLALKGGARALLQKTKNCINQVIQQYFLVTRNPVFYEISLSVLNECLHLFMVKFFSSLQFDNMWSSSDSSSLAVSSEWEKVSSGSSVWLLEAVHQYKNLVTA